MMEAVENCIFARNDKLLGKMENDFEEKKYSYRRR